MKTLYYLSLISLLSCALGAYNLDLKYIGRVDDGTEMPTSREQSGVTTDPVTKKAYLFGGENGGPFNDLWEFNMNTNGWTLLEGEPFADNTHTQTRRADYEYGVYYSPTSEHNPGPRSGVAAFWKDGSNLCLFSGQTHTPDVWCYDLAQSSWAVIEGTDQVVGPTDGNPGGRKWSRYWSRTNSSGVTTAYFYGGFVDIENPSVLCYKDIWSYTLGTGFKHITGSTVAQMRAWSYNDSLVGEWDPSIVMMPARYTYAAYPRGDDEVYFALSYGRIAGYSFSRDMWKVVSGNMRNPAPPPPFPAAPTGFNTIGADVISGQYHPDNQYGLITPIVGTAPCDERHESIVALGGYYIPNDGRSSVSGSAIWVFNSTIKQWAYISTVGENTYMDLNDAGALYEGNVSFGSIDRISSWPDHNNPGRYYILTGTCELWNIDFTDICGECSPDNPYLYDNGTVRYCTTECPTGWEVDVVSNRTCLEKSIQKVCNEGFELDTNNSCVPVKVCNEGFELDTNNSCVPVKVCDEGFELGTNSSCVVVQQVCGEGFEKSTNGTCVAVKECDKGFKKNSDKVCVAISGSTRTLSSTAFAIFVVALITFA